MKPTFIALLALCLCVVGCGKSSPVDESTLAYDDRLTAELPAAEQGDAEAQYKIGWMYQEGQGVEQDFKEALKWFQKSAEQGHADGQTSLGGMYYSGEGVEQDNATSYAWWNIAATNGVENAKIWKLKIAKAMTPEQIAKAEELVKEMVKKNPKLLRK